MSKNAFKLYHKVRDHCHYTGKFRGAAHGFCNLRYKIPKEIPIVFHNGSTYDYHFIINKLAKELDGQLECLGENTEKFFFSVPISKELDNVKKITYRLKFIDSLRFCQPHNQVLLIIYLKLTEKNVEIKIVNKHEILLGLKIIDYITNAQNVTKSS